MPPSADQIVSGWIEHFWAADHEIEWLYSEIEHSFELQAGVWLMGRIDAIGRDSNSDPFFGEWKTSKPEWKTRKGEWKKTYKMNPQTLTYGVLVDDFCQGEDGPPSAESLNCRRFTVRKAFKTEPPTFDHAWYSYSPKELRHWRSQLLQIASEIRGYMRDWLWEDAPGVNQKWEAKQPWPTNFDACFQYGLQYACPFFEPACSKTEWSGVPVNAIARMPHLEAERRLNTYKDEGCPHHGTEHRHKPSLAPYMVQSAFPDGVVILDATRVARWLSCRERFRREYIENITVPPNEALQLGLDCHTLWGEYYRSLIPKKEAKPDA